MPDPKILYYDIETSHDVLAKFGLREEYTSYENILQDWHLLSAAWKWKGKKHIHGLCISKPGDDKEVCKALAEAIGQADAIVGHNSIDFDIRKLNTRLIKNGLPPLPNVRHIDTKRLAKRHFAFSSNSMDNIARELGLPRKADTEKGLWLRCLKGDLKAYADMLKYNKQDIAVLEAVADRLAPFIEPIINMVLWRSAKNERPEEICPNCGDNDYQLRGYRYTTSGRYRQFACKPCGKFWQSTKASLRVPIK